MKLSGAVGHFDRLVGFLHLHVLRCSSILRLRVALPYVNLLLIVTSEE